MVAGEDLERGARSKDAWNGKAYGEE